MLFEFHEPGKHLLGVKMALSSSTGSHTVPKYCQTSFAIAPDIVAHP